MNMNFETMVLKDPPGLYVWSPELYEISPSIFKSIYILGTISIIFIAIVLVKKRSIKFALINFALYIISIITLNLAKEESLNLIYIDKTKYILTISISMILRIIIVFNAIIKIIRKSDKISKGEEEKCQK